MKKSLPVCSSWNFKLAPVRMGRKPPEQLKLGAADAQFATFCLLSRTHGLGSPLSRKSQKRRKGPNAVCRDDKFRRKDLHDAVRAVRNEIPPPARRPGNGCVGVRTFRVLDPLHDASQCPAVRSESIRLGTTPALRGRLLHALAQNKSLLPAAADGSALPVERVRAVSAGVLPAATLSGALGRADSLHGSDGAAGSVCGWAGCPLPLA
jgi:hypothetical protein